MDERMHLCSHACMALFLDARLKLSRMNIFTLPHIHAYVHGRCRAGAGASAGAGGRGGAAGGCGGGGGDGGGGSRM